MMHQISFLNDSTIERAVKAFVRTRLAQRACGGKLWTRGMPIRGRSADVGVVREAGPLPGIGYRSVVQDTMG